MELTLTLSPDKMSMKTSSKLVSKKQTQNLGEGLIFYESGGMIDIDEDFLDFWKEFTADMKKYDKKKIEKYSLNPMLYIYDLGEAVGFCSSGCIAEREISRLIKTNPKQCDIYENILDFLSGCSWEDETVDMKDLQKRLGITSKLIDIGGVVFTKINGTYKIVANTYSYE